MKNNLLQKTIASAKRNVATPCSKKNRWSIIVSEKDDNRKLFESLIELSYLVGEINPQFEQHKKAVGKLLFDQWTAELWKNKSVPDNPRIVLSQQHNNMEDHRFLLQIKFRTDGIKKFAQDLKSNDPENQLTVHELLMNNLVAMGLSKKHAHAFVTEEIHLKDKLVSWDFADKLECGTDMEKSVANKILQFFNKRSKTNKASVDLITEEEADAVGSLFEYHQEILIKEGMFERVWNYVENLEQLRLLLKFCNVIIQVSHFEFAISSSKEEQMTRAMNAVKTHLLIEKH
jgi:hypothetical protein